MYEVINEKLGIAKCSLEELTLKQVQQFLGQWEPEANIGELTLFYDEKEDLIVLNRDIDYVCPLCDKEVMSDAESRNNYCGECGCKFDWSDEQ